MYHEFRQLLYLSFKPMVDLNQNLIPGFSLRLVLKWKNKNSK